MAGHGGTRYLFASQNIFKKDFGASAMAIQAKPLPAVVAPPYGHWFES